MKTLNSKSNIALSAIIVLVFILAGIFLLSRPKLQPTVPTTTNGEEVSETQETSDWKTFSDPKSGVSFEYPENLSTDYIGLVDWPPLLQVIEGPFTCTNAGEEEARAGKTETKIINGHQYCVTTVAEGAAGSIYTQYAYAAQKEDKTLYFTFTLRAVQCGNYDEPQKIACEEERTTFSIDQLIDQIIQTARYE